MRKKITVQFLIAIVNFMLLSTAGFAKTHPGRIIILSDPKIADLNGDMVASNPERLSELLLGAGFEVKLATPSQFSDNKILNYKDCDVAILPYGPYFPSVANENFRTFIRTGGKFISIGGYAFAEQIGPDYKLDPNAPILGSRDGSDIGDHLILYSHQIPVFDWDYPLRFAVKASPVENQYLFDKRIEIDEDLKGWAACGIIADNKARWQPLINSYNRYGELRGAVGAVMHIFTDNKPGQNYIATDSYIGKASTSDALNDSLQEYSGSSWAFFGVTNKDLFDGTIPAMDDGVIKLVKFLIKDVYLKYTTTDLTSYHQGETVTLKTAICNGGRRQAKGIVLFEIEDVNFSKELPYEVNSREAQYLQTQWSPDKFENDYYEFTVTLKNETGEIADKMKQGFTIWNPETISKSLDVHYKDNYFKFNDEAMVVFGTDASYRPFSSLYTETPFHWREDCEKRQDFGFSLYETLQQSRRRENKDMLRRVESTIQLCRKYNQIYMMGIMIGANVAATDGEMVYNQEWVGRMAQRYKGISNLIYYLNGDLRVVLAPEHKTKWNEFLKERYSSIDKLRDAWGKEAEEKDFGEFEIDECMLSTTGEWMKEGEWTNPKLADYNHFRTWMIRNWCSKLIRAIRHYVPDNPIVCEFYSWPFEAVDTPLGMGELTFSNIGFFEEYEKAPEHLLYSDQRSIGKSFGIGEYGKRTHKSFYKAKWQGHRPTSPEGQLNHYLILMHLVKSLGGSHINNWCWNDSDGVIFPWGLNHPSDYVPKDSLHWIRNCSLFFRQMEPVWKASKVGFLTADNNRMSGGVFFPMHFADIRAIKTLIASGAGEICTLNEYNLVIPKEVKVIFYPIPYLPPDEVIKRLSDYVNNGGTVYVSGDISYDELSRKRTHTDRLEKLCGVKFISENYPNILSIQMPPIIYKSTDGVVRAGRPCINIKPLTARVLWKTEDDKPVVVSNKIGKGEVIFSADPIELQKDTVFEADTAFYRWILARAGVKPLNVEPYNPNIYAIKLPLTDGGVLYTFFNFDKQKPIQSVTLRETVMIEVKSQRPAALWFDAKGKLKGVETQGKVIIAGKLLLCNQTDGIIYSADGNSLVETDQMVLLPIKAGRVQIVNVSAKDLKVEVGEVRKAAWQDYESISCTVEKDSLTFNIDQLQASKIILIGKEIKDLERAVTSKLVHK